MSSNEYFDYLLYIGIILPENTVKIKELIQNKIKEKSEENDNNILFMKNLIGDYLTSLDKESLYKLGINIYNQYKKNKSITIFKQMMKVFNILKKVFFQKIKYYYNILKNNYYLVYNTNTDKFPRSQSSDKMIKLNKYFNYINISEYNNYNNNYCQKSQKEFFERMNEYNTKKEKNKKYQRALKEEEINFICTFSPDLSLTKKDKNFNKKLNTNRNYNSLENIDEEKPIRKKRVNNNRMLKLYNDYQQNRIKQQKLKENIDKENGITFSPKLNKDSKYNKKIKNNLYERNKQLLNDKKSFVKGFNLLRDLQIKGLNINRISIDFSNDKK